jgi:hypothetical protein
MPNANIAERILSLVTTPDRAGATVGDLIESRVGALRFWFTIASQVLRRLVIPGVLGFLAQFFLFFWAGFALRFSIIHLSRPFTVVRITLLATQVLVGYVIARYGKMRALGICLIVILADCVIGAMNVNNANINMAVWAIPLLASTLVTRRNVGPTPSHRPH